MKVSLSAQAERDLHSIFQYIHKDSPKAAQEMLDRLRLACLELGSRPLLYPYAPRYEGKGIRRRVLGSYGIYYLVSPGLVQVITIVHSARDVDRLLFPEG